MTNKKIIAIFTFFLVGLFLYNSLNQRTFVPIELNEIRGFVPSSQTVEQKIYSKFYDFHRDADNYFYHSKRVAEQFKYDSNGETEYSFDTMLGYPIGPEIENASGIGDYVTRVIINCCITDNYEASLVSSDLTLIIWALISFYTLIFIGNILKYDNKMSVALALICNPALFIYSYEGTLMSVVGSQLLFLSFIGLSKTSSKYFYIFAFIGSLSIFNSNDYHFYLYFPLTLLLFTPYIIKKLGYKSSFILYIAIGIPFLLSFEKLLWVNDLLSTSLQNPDLKTAVINRSYHPLIISGLVELPLVKMISSQILSAENQNIVAFLFPTTVMIIGYVVGVLACISIYNIKDRLVSIPIILLILYWMGPFHYFLGLISSSFQAETSIRINILLYMVFALLSFDAIKQGNIYKYKNFLIRTSWIILILSITQFLVISIYDIYRGLEVVWFSAIPHITSIIFLLFFLYLRDRKYLLLALLILPISNGFLFTGVRTFQSHDYSNLVRMNQEFNSIFHQDDVAMLFSSIESNDSIHPNAFMQSKFRVIQAYLTPNPEAYSKLYWQQYFSYDSYLDYNKIEKIIIDKSKYLDITGPTMLNDNNLSIETENYIMLSGVNKLITTSEITLNKSKYSLVFSGYGVKVFEIISPSKSFYGSCNIVNKKISAILKTEELFDEMIVNNAAFSEDGPSIRFCNNPPVLSNKVINKKDSKISLNISGRGLIVTNLSFNNNLKAIVENSGKELKVIKCNIAYTCIMADQLIGNTQISISYLKPSFKSLFE